MFDSTDLAYNQTKKKVFSAILSTCAGIFWTRRTEACASETYRVAAELTSRFSPGIPSFLCLWLLTPVPVQALFPVPLTFSFGGFNSLIYFLICFTEVSS